MQGDSPKLSILIPFKGDDPSPLVNDLANQDGVLTDDLDVVLFDDGNDGAFVRLVKQRFVTRALPVRTISAGRNVGRAAARNRLAASARAPWLLYLDADMRVGRRFLSGHMGAIQDAGFDAAFGGFLSPPPDDPAFALHAALSAASGTHQAERRSHIGASAFCTSNLLVRADIMRDIPFDEGFVGWGWEDVDWAATAARSYRLVHLDNPAGHSGWQASEQLLDRFRDSARNFARLLAKHPELRTLPGARAAAALARVPGQRHLRGLLAASVRRHWMPLRVRVLAIKLWRASWAAEEVRA